MQESDVTWRHAMSISWFIAWRFFVGEMLICILVGFVLAAALGADRVLNFAKDALEPSSGISGTLAYTLVAVINVVWMIVVIRMALTKQYKNFRIELVAH